jgi:hypothetical protein
VKPAHLTAVPRSEQSASKVGAPALVAEGEKPREGDSESPSLSGFGRLMTVEKAAEYLAISPWLLRQYVLAGDLVTVELPRPATASAIRTGARAPKDTTLRMIRFDRADLDDFVDQHAQKVRR